MVRALLLLCSDIFILLTINAVVLLLHLVVVHVVVVLHHRVVVVLVVHLVVVVYFCCYFPYYPLPPVVCCPENTFGSSCQPCPGGVDNVCGGRGKCEVRTHPPIICGNIFRNLERGNGTSFLPSFSVIPIPRGQRRKMGVASVSVMMVTLETSVRHVQNDSFLKYLLLPRVMRLQSHPN